MSATGANAKELRISGLRKAYAMRRGPSVPAVRDFSLTLAPGEFVTLLGPSGCGKTTVLRTLAGLEDLDGGEIVLDGRSIAGLPAYRRRIGLVFQNYALFPHMSVFENVAYSLRLKRTPEPTVRAEVGMALEAVGLAEFGQRLPGQLSGGQQQRVAVARALVMKPDLLLFDEPLSNLDARLRVQVRAELRRLQRNLGTTALYVTHDQEEAMSLSDRIAVMRAGRVEQVGTPQDIYARPASLFVAEFVGKVTAIPGRIVDRFGDAVVLDMLGHRHTLPAGAGVIPPALPADVVVVARPEAVALTGPGPDRPTGTVEDTEYLGDRVEYRVRTGGLLVTAIEPGVGGPARWAEGASVGLAFPGTGLHILPADAARP